MVLNSIYCECLNVCITEYDDEKNVIVLGQEKVKELEYKTGIFGLRECSATWKFKLPSLIGKRVLHGADIYRCHLCNSDIFVVYKGHRMLTDLVRAQERHHKNFSSLFRVNIPPPLNYHEKSDSLSANHGGLDYCAIKDRWFDIVEVEKKRLYDELQKKLYDYIKKEEEIYNEKCKKIDQQCERLKCICVDLLHSTEEVTIGTDEIKQLAKPECNVSELVTPLISIVESVDDSLFARRFSGADSQFGSINDQEMFLLDEDEMSAFPRKELVECRTNFLKRGESPSRFHGEDNDQEDKDFERIGKKSTWRPTTLARSCALTIPRPELGSPQRSRASGDEKTEEEESFGRGQLIPPHTYVERLNKKIVPYSIPGRPVSRD